MATKMAFEGEIYYGAKGATASTKLTNVRDVNYNLDPKKGDTTTRGSGSTPPITSQRVTELGVTIEFTMLEKTSDTSLEALKAAAFTGAAVAIRTKDYASAKGFDGDCILDCKKGEPHGAEQTWQFTATPTAEDRDPQLYV